MGKELWPQILGGELRSYECDQSSVRHDDVGRRTQSETLSLLITPFTICQNFLVIN
jgi:hypothetical protein